MDRAGKHPCMWDAGPFDAVKPAGAFYALFVLTVLAAAMWSVWRNEPDEHDNAALDRLVQRKRERAAKQPRRKRPTD